MTSNELTSPLEPQTAAGNEGRALQPPPQEVRDVREAAAKEGEGAAAAREVQNEGEGGSDPRDGREEVSRAFSSFESLSRKQSQSLTRLLSAVRQLRCPRRLGRSTAGQWSRVEGRASRGDPVQDARGGGGRSEAVRSAAACGEPNVGPSPPNFAYLPA